jgi:hypothetical protein
LRRRKPRQAVEKDDAKEEVVSSQLSVAQVLANLETQMALHKEREAYHAQQEVFHREQRAAHAEGYETVAKHYEAFKMAAGGTAEIAARVAVAAEAVPSEAPPPELPPSGKRPQPGPLVIRVIEKMPPGQAFGASQVAAEVNRRFPRSLRRPMDSRLASAVLRRLLAEETVRLARQGSPHHEALYTRS